MKFSICLSTGFEGVMYPIPFAGPGDFVAQAQLCERLGYHSVWGNDHITTQKYVTELHPGKAPNFYEPLITLAMCAQATERLMVGTALLVMPMREPVYLAKQVATLDRLSGGRFILAVGLGAYREEFTAMSPRLKGARRGDMLDEGIEAFLELITETSASHDGNFYAFKDVAMFPKPKQDPYPLFIGGHNMATVERAARYGHGWLSGWRPLPELEERIKILKNRTAELGRPQDAVEIAPQFSMLLAKTDEEAETNYMASGLVAHRQSLAYTARDLSQQVAANLVGSPNTVIEKIEKLKSIGVDHCSALMIPANTLAEMNDQIEWFAHDVMAKV
ncbi:MAG: TIGR03619 family F420-dependent LLM class oxidoreductase [Rhodospirillaceae bacterium]|jgi:probable F420-dependent oxidoreductase|nr:TIGR03619 family F420-dependent LLM class oxidoreductase [Rhodospirillaceae bacterium]MBT3493095.1 TIGR03619 family F420-dependent LLM class oxidoreductase [Rhodospirillaceae bacterium]MBT3779472.1 TIGR03619 family F420-dependent LLM class oxidoreductase [Rhodospirillaceae bacterium]MBT3977137.1 TIGR03619 family F420-dependent LLM class oxidoreductase [Rhodospirillaceae bacterium]MBT4171333.1 TIGR03619 family F420-dependent LLM class oxidoreductase [Rhodospirillaceae bacterium]